VEPDPSIEAAEALAEENGVRDRIEIIRALSTDIELPERADVVVTDLRGVLPLFGTHLETLRDIHARHLATGGVCIPRRDVLSVAVIEDADAYSRLVRTWDALPGDMRHESLDRLLANRWYRLHASAQSMLTEPLQWLAIDYARPSTQFDGRVTLAATRDGTAHAVLCWFDTELVDGISFSNSPKAPRALYGQAMFPLETPLAMRVGDRAHVRMRAVRSADEHLWSWDLALERNGTHVEERRQSFLHGLPLSRTALARRSSAFIPAPSTDASVLRTLLNAADGTRSIEQLAIELHLAMPERFPSGDDALRYVAQCEHLWR
jgi:type I protein arginine methyltransferase